MMIAIIFFLNFMTISYTQMLRIRHIDQNIYHKVQPHSHPQDVVFQLNKCYSVTTSRPECNQVCMQTTSTYSTIQYLALETLTE